MARVRIVLRDAGMEALLSSRGLRDDLMERGERVVDRARSKAPVVSGDYRRSLSAFPEQHKTRVVVHVTSSVSYAGIVEASHRTLGMSIDAAGDR